MRPEILAFAKAMEYKLKKNDHKSGWKDCDLIFLENKLKEELREFQTAFDNQSNRLLNEGADVANIIMMICDVLGKLKPAFTGSEKEE